MDRPSEPQRRTAPFASENSTEVPSLRDLYLTQPQGETDPGENEDRVPESEKEPYAPIVDRPLDPVAAARVKYPGVGVVVTRQCHAESLLREASNVATVRGRVLHIIIVHEDVVDDIPALNEWEDRIYQLAHRLEASAIKFKRSNVLRTLTDYSRQFDVRLLIAESHPNPMWRFWEKPLSNALINSSDLPPVFVLRSFSPAAGKTMFPHRHWLVMAGVILFVALFNFSLRNNLPLEIQLLMYVLGVAFVASISNQVVSIAASFLAMLCYNFFSAKPVLAFGADNTTIVVLLSFFLVSMIISTFSWQAQKSLDETKSQERQSAAFYGLTRDLLTVSSGRDVAALVESHLQDILQANVAVFVEQAGQIETLHPAPIDFDNAPSDRTARDRAVLDGIEAGIGAQVSPLAFGLYLPIRGKAGLKGALAVYPKANVGTFPPGQLRVLDTFSSLVGVALERIRFDTEQRRSEQQLRDVFMQNTLLRSVSHDLKTPLTSITGFANQLAEDPGQPADQRTEIYATIRDEAWRLTNLINNLLSITKLESEAIQLDTEPMFVEELIGTAVGQLRDRTAKHQLKIDVSDDLPEINADPMMFNQALVNLIENAVKYTPEGSYIVIRSRPRGENKVVISVLDNGPGLPKEALSTVFDKFVRFTSGKKVEGTGLGLAIVKAIVELHGGTVRASNRSTGGARFTMTLPALKRTIPFEETS